MRQVKVVALSHYSVKEYLISERILQSRAAHYSMQDIACHEFMAMSCIGYLLQFQPGSVSHRDIQGSELALYAAEFWIWHARAVAHKAEALNSIIMELFLTRNDSYLNWARMYDPDDPEDNPGLLSKTNL